jgi:hypothetical protein
VGLGGLVFLLSLLPGDIWCYRRLAVVFLCLFFYRSGFHEDLFFLKVAE